MTDTNKLKELAERATPGPWTLYVPENYQGPEELPGYGVECAEGRAIIWGALEPETGCQFDRDAEFIAAANPQAILGLIAEVERLRARLEIDERTPYDGIACRDETIKGLDEKCDRLKAEVERLRKVEALQNQVNEHYKRWYRECIDEPFDTWLKDDATHWIGEQDAAFQAWQYLHENKIWLMKERIEEHEQERDQLKAENEALRKDAERYRWLKDQGHFRAMSIDMGGNHTWTGMGRNVGCGPTVDDAIDAALEGGGR